MSSSSDDYPATDPRAWRNECFEPLYPWPTAKEAFEHYKQLILNLDGIPHFHDDERRVLLPGEDKAEAEVSVLTLPLCRCMLTISAQELRKIYHEHGWPGPCGVPEGGVQGGVAVEGEAKTGGK